MSSNKDEAKALPIVLSSATTLLAHKEILFPFICILFVQFLILELLYFIPRYPLNVFFDPIVRTIWGEAFLHYPLNLSLLPKFFQIAQTPIYIFVNSFFIALSIRVMALINSGESLKNSSPNRDVLKSYIYLIFAAVITFACVMGFFKLTGMVQARALMIRSQSGHFYTLKKVILVGMPYYNLLASIFVTTLFAYMYHFIIIDKNKIFKAYINNFKLVFKSFWSTLAIVFLPSLLFVPIIILRGSLQMTAFAPEFTVLILALSIVCMVLIDMIVYTSLTTLFLIKKENQ